MSELQFPKDPVVGQQYDFPPYKYYWDGVKWKTMGIGYNPVNDLRNELEPRIETSEKNIEDLSAQSFEALRRSYAEAGFNLVDGSFEEGAVISGWPDVVWSQALGIYLQWHLDEAKTVAAGSTPKNIGTEWIDKSNKLLKSDVEYLLAKNVIYVEDYLPDNCAIDGSVNYIKEVQQAIKDAATAYKYCIFPEYPIGIDVSTLASVNSLESGIEIPSNSKIVGGDLRMFPTAYAGYALMWMDNVDNVYIKGTKLTGDKYTHTGPDGEHGMGFSIRGNTTNVVLEDITADSCWGDGLYVGQLTSTDEFTPKNITVKRAKLLNNRRNNCSIIAIENGDFDDIELSGANSSDSQVILPKGPHAGLDIEPNSFYGKIKNLRIRNLHGSNNGAELLQIYFASAATLVDTSKTYDISITIDGVYDEGSKGAIAVKGLSPAMTNCAGVISIENVVSKSALKNSIYISDWFKQAGVELLIDKVSLIDWADNPSLTKIERAPICITSSESAQYPSSTYPIQGNFKITNILLDSKQESGNLYAIYTGNHNGFDKATVDIIGVKNYGNMISRVFGKLNTNLHKEFGCGLINNVTGNIYFDFATLGDYSVSETSAITLPSASSSRYYEQEYLLKVTANDDTTFVRLLSSTFPMYVNGTLCTAANFYRKAGIVKLKITASAYIVNVEGLVSSYT